MYFGRSYIFIASCLLPFDAAYSNFFFSVLIYLCCARTGSAHTGVNALKRAFVLVSRPVLAWS